MRKTTGTSTSASLKDGSPTRSGLGAFYAAAVRNPALVGACSPSSRALGERMASTLPATPAPTVVELGAGTGALTRVIREHVPPRGRYLAVERDARLLSHVEGVWPDVEAVHGDAADLGSLLADREVTEVDAVVCGLPWSLLSVETQQRILGEISKVLTPHGVFVSFAYIHAVAMPRAKRFRAALEDTFADVRLVRPVWRNLPPATMYVCRAAGHDDGVY